MGAPRKRGAAGAAAGRDPPARGCEHLVELVEAGVEPEQLVATLGEEILAERVAPVHLEHQAAQVPKLLVTRALDDAPLAADHARGRQRPPGRLCPRGAAEAAQESHRPVESSFAGGLS